MVAKAPNDTQRPEGLPFFDERDLRDFIAAKPERIGLKTPAAVAVEVRVPPMIGRADIVVVDADGAITIVECKLHKNPEGHGAVIGQALSYAAGLEGLRLQPNTYEAFKERFERAKGAGPGALTRPFLGRVEGWNEAEFSEAVAQSLESGSFRVVIAADELSEQLKMILAFLSERQMSGIELSKYEVYPRTPGEKRSKLTAETLCSEIRRFYPGGADACRELLRWADQAGLRPVVDSERFEAKVTLGENTLFRIKRYSEVRVSLGRISRQLRRQDDLSAEINSNLDALGFQRDAEKAKIKLWELDAPAFTALMQRVVTSLKSAGT